MAQSPAGGASKVVPMNVDSDKCYQLCLAAVGEQLSVNETRVRHNPPMEAVSRSFCTLSTQYRCYASVLIGVCKSTHHTFARRIAALECSTCSSVRNCCRIWAYWISPFAYLLRAIVINEMTSPHWDIPYGGTTLGVVSAPHQHDSNL